LSNFSIHTIIQIILALFPVYLFLTVLIFLDSFKIVKFRSVVMTIIIGTFVALISLFTNSAFLNAFQFDLSVYSRYLAPAVEELLKSFFIIYLIKSKKIGFMVDAAIYGFAVGSGFAFVENIYYLQHIESTNILLWIIRGFGTAVMHGGTTASFAILSKSLIDRHSSEAFYLFLPGLSIAFVIHSFFNHFLISPIIMTVLQLIILPLIIFLVFQRSERALRDWLELGLDSDVTMLDDITTGNISRTKVGQYLQSLKERFPGETLADMICFLRIHLELAIRAKGFLLMQEAGFKVKKAPEIKEKFEELTYLEKSLGKTGMLAISPILHNSTQDLWQLYLLDKK